ncbi:MAG: tRNA (adenosine(37)-N6)-dimethylallyltransferase MiaA [Clostridia bacterium]|nr:tRNA (adenosine(37)-N6)-dimethylallyltransferase MiaA [Clostridia bacterium]
MKQKVIIIGGATASGKSSLAMELAKKLNTEIISCDSMQVYKEMNIGTAKPSIKDMKFVKHYMIDIINPDEDFNVVKYVSMVNPLIEDILSRNKIPIIVGGTGLYVEALMNNIDFSEESTDLDYRKKMEKVAKEKGNEEIHNMLKEIDIDSANRLSINDTKRIIRALEVYHTTGKTITYYNSISKNKDSKYDFILFGIDVPREELYQRINDRVDKMIEKGLVNEVEKIYNKYSKFPTAMQGLGYKEVIRYLKEEITLEEMIELIKKETRHYAKRQITWFKAYKSIIWLSPQSSIEETIQKM